MACNPAVLLQSCCYDGQINSSSIVVLFVELILVVQTALWDLKAHINQTLRACDQLKRIAA